MENGDSKMVSVSNVNSTILRKVLAWAEYHKDDPQPMEKRAPLWDPDFLKDNESILIETTHAASYLSINRLIRPTCQALTNMLKGKSVEGVRKTFNIENDKDI